MQQIVPTLAARNPNNHTQAEILAALRGKTGSRRLHFRYEVYNSSGTFLSELTGVVSGSIAYNSLADIKRTATFVIRDDGTVNYLSDRIKPYARLLLPPWGTNDWVEWPQGVFLLSTPARTADEAGVILRNVQGYDQLQIFTDDKVSTRYTVDAGANYLAAVLSLLAAAGVTYNVAPSTATAVTAREWEPGTPKLKIINEILSTVNYRSLWFDEEGVAQVQPYVSPANRPEEYVYADDSNSVMLSSVEQTLDLFTVPNQWVLVVSEPDRPALVGTYTNTDPSSPTSTVRRARTITDFRTEQDAPDQGTLDSQAARLAFEASQVYEAIDWESAIMPIHADSDVYRLTYSQLAVDAKYAEQTWDFDLVAGAVMRHRARRIVNV